MRRALWLLMFASAPAMAQDMDHSHHHMAPAEPQEPGEPAPAQAAMGNAPAPATPSDHAADRIFPAKRMAAARAAMMDEMRFSTATIMVDEFELRAGKHGEGYAWDAEAWYGGDIDRVALATEGEGETGRSPGHAEVRAAWRHALDPWFNLELGVRHDIRPDPERSYAMIGIEGLAPYWFEVEGQLFLSNKGDAHARVEASYDQRLTQYLILQPKLEVNAAFQDVPELRIGAGLEAVELGARLRYQFAPEFAPYVGVTWERKVGRSADYAREFGERPAQVQAVLGVRAWF